MSDGMRRELVYLSSHATNRYFIPNWGPALSCPREDCRQASPSGWTCSNPREALEVQTARDCGIGSSISCRFLLILTPKGSHFK